MRNQGYVSSFASINATFASQAAGNATPKNGTLTEVACAPRQNCNTDQLAFRSILARAIFQLRALTEDLTMFATVNSVNTTNPANLSAALEGPRVPAWSFHERIDFVLRTSAQGAAAQCSGGKSGTVCGSDWGAEEWDGSEGLGQDLSALNIFLANLPFEGKLATVNGTAGGAAGGEGESGDAGGDGGEDGAAEEVAASEGAAGHVTVLSSVGLLLAGVSSLMILL